jgi:RND superfamily putative drug exporter
VLLTLAIPALRMETGFPDAGNDATSTTHRRAYDLLAEGFGPGFNAPLLIVADLTSPGVDADGIPELSAARRRRPRHRVGRRAPVLHGG